MFFVMANSLIGGRARGMAATGGIMLGGVFHTIFGAFFVGVIAQMTPIVLQLILLASASYMAWIGFTLLRSSITVSSIGNRSAGTLHSAFGQGFITCILNPKAYVFVLAVYPQFIQARFGSVWSQALVMGVLTIFTQMIIYGGLGLAAAKSRDWLISNPRVTIWIGRSAGTAFILVGAMTVLRVITAGV